ncbi:hypothetical protein SETIT_9G137800v2 [Setaria italica]|uniref:F-box associated domain-containing protein n=1 Tax=Setaria italica TaxID=4555 RepID=A0A368SI26_SETIT|nr:hypothetical protein SETIT_9G137800v2 [Setaria italica]
MFVVTNQPEAAPEFFARPSMTRKIAGKLESYVRMEKHYNTPDIEDCCNGHLLLLEEHVVVNPATRQWARLPPCPSTTSPEGADEGSGGFYDVYLVFDPTSSPHYKVLSMKNPLDYKGKVSKGSGWPPSVYMMRVYSPETRRWEERPFVREGGPLETTANVRASMGHATYWHEALVIKFPAGINGTELYLGKSKRQRVGYDNYDQEDNEGPIVEKILDWDSDDDNAVEIQDPDANCFYGYNQIFGFHLYKEIVFLRLSSSRVVAYHFNSKKIQELGKLPMKNHHHEIDTTFIYTPCWTGELSEYC